MAGKALRLSLAASSTSADHQALEWRLMRPKGMEDLAAFSAREVKSSSRGKRKRRIFHCGRTVRVKVGDKVIPASFLKVKDGGRSLGRKAGERGTDRRIGRWSDPRS